MAASVPKTLTKPIWIALGAGLLSLAATAIQGAARDGYDSWHQAVSALSLGPSGWIQMMNLVAWGAVILTSAMPWRRILSGGKGETAYPITIALTGIGFIVVGLVPQDPAPGYDPMGLALTAPTPHGIVHLAVAGVTALSTVIGLFVMAARFTGDPVWKRWPLYSCLAAVAMIVCITAYGVWSVKPTGFAGTFERAAMVIPMIWTYAFLRRVEVK